MFATEVGERIVIAGVSGRGPARKADVRPGDIVLDVGGKEIRSLSGFFRSIWAQGAAGVEVPMVLNRDGKMHEPESEVSRPRPPDEGPDIALSFRA